MVSVGGGSRLRTLQNGMLQGQVGDWGAGGAADQRAVADAMAEVASQKPISFVVSTGNNFAAGATCSL